MGGCQFPFPVDVPAPAGTGMGAGIFVVAGMLFTCGWNIVVLALAAGLLYKTGGVVPSFMKPLREFDQEACHGLLDMRGGIAASALAALRLRITSQTPTRPASSPSSTTRPATITIVLSDEPVAGVSVLLPLLLPGVVPFVAATWLLATVGDALTVGVVPVVAVVVVVALAAAVTVGVIPGVVVCVGAGVGLGVGVGDGDGRGVGEGGATGALYVKLVELGSIAVGPLPVEALIV